MPPDDLSHRLTEALDGIVRATASWWIVGSGAMASHGLRLTVADVDLLLAPSDAARLLEERGSSPNRTDEDGRFRSDVFGLWTGGPLPVDVMGGLHALREARWIEVRPITRVAFELTGGTVFVPSVAEFGLITRLFGRSKDAARAKLLGTLLVG